jgi:mono/diheme cytochrome c family protein
MSDHARAVAALGIFPTADAIGAAVASARKQGFSRLDVVSPYPLHGIDHLLGKGPSRLGSLALVAALLGVVLAAVAQWWVSAVDYPLSIGGRPLFCWQASVPVSLVVMILAAALATVLGMLTFLNGLPDYRSALRHSPHMARLSCDQFGLLVDARDPLFREQMIRAQLRSLGASVSELLHAMEPECASWQRVFSPRFAVVLMAVALTCTAATRLIWRYGGALPPYDHMKSQIRVDPYESWPAQSGGSAMWAPVAGTVPRGLMPYRYAEKPQEAGALMLNPAATDTSVLAAGRRGYESFCQHCHGPAAHGNGFLTEAFPRAPSLHSSKAREWPDGRIYHVITSGQNAMPGHQSQITRQRRWEIVHHLRALQRSASAPDPELP